jgi:putative ABC transport system ATP-binding protein
MPNTPPRPGARARTPCARQDAMIESRAAQDTAPVSALHISARGLTRVFGSGGQAVTAVRGIDLDVLTGEFLAVMGRSGSGKTTLLNLLAGLDRPTSGQVFFGGRNLNAFSEAELVAMRRGQIGFIFQSFGLLPLLSADENVELPLHIRGVPRRERRRRVLEALGLVGLGARARHRPYELSGGEQQRVSIARALVISPEVLFADEPTGELDTLTAMSIATLLRDIARERGVTVVVATHDLALAEMSSRQVELADGALKP